MNVVVTRLVQLASTRQGNHDRLPTSISSLAAHFSLSISHIHPTFKQLYASNHIDRFIPPSTFILHFASDFLIYPKCLPKLPRRNPLLAAKLQLAEKLLPRRRKLARRQQHPLAKRRSVTRRARRHIPHISTRVRFLLSRNLVPTRLSIRHQNS